MNRGLTLPRLLGAGVAIAVLSLGGLAMLSWRSANRHRAAAESTLDDFAGVALDRYAATVESLLRQALMPSFGLLGFQQLARPGDGLADLREMATVPDQMAADPCNCLPVLRPEAWFRINLSDSSAVVIDPTGRRIPSALEWLGRVPARLAQLSSERFRFAGFVIDQPACTRMVYATVLHDSAGVPTQIYGMSVFSSVVAREVFERAYNESRLPPRFLSGEISNGDYVTLAVRAADGKLLYQSPVEHRSPHADSVQLGSRRGELRIAATLNPAYADRLLVGGVPRSPARAILISAGITLALLLGVGWLAWRIVELARLRADFTSSVTHELRTPLTQIRLSAETLLLGRARGERERTAALQEIVTETERLQHLVDNVLHFSRAERQLVPLTPVDQPLAPLVVETVNGFVPVAAERGALLQVEVSPTIGVRVDHQALHQILLNLLDNAVRYGPEGQTIVVSASDQGPTILLVVADQGDGIPPADRERVWRPFVRLESAIETNRTGSGLGLAVVHQLVTASGGSVSIDGNLPRGTRMGISLPAAELTLPEPSPADNVTEAVAT